MANGYRAFIKSIMSANTDLAQLASNVFSFKDEGQGTIYIDDLSFETSLGSKPKI